MHSPALARTPIWATLVVVLTCIQSGCNDATSANSANNTVAAAKTNDRTKHDFYALGRLEPAGGIISIGAIPGERLHKLAPGLKEGKIVPASGELGHLFSYEIATKQLAALKKKSDLLIKKNTHEKAIASAQLAQAIATLAQAKAKQTELEVQAGKLKPLKKGWELAKADYDRLLEIKDKNLVPQHQLDRQKNKLDMAEQEYLIAAATGEAAIAAAHKAVEAANKNIDVAELTLVRLEENHEKLAVEQEIEVAEETAKRSILVAPSGVGNNDSQSTRSTYTVLRLFTREGESVAQLPIMQLGDLSKMVCIAEVYETDIGAVKNGQKVKLYSQAFSGDYRNGIEGRVIRKGRMVGSPGIVNRNPLAPADRSVVEVRIEITDEAAAKHAAERVGLQVKVGFDTTQPDEPAS